MNLNLNSSDSRELDEAELRLGDGEEATLRSGTRYPIMTANYSALGTSGVNIPGLTTAGNSSSLSSLLSSLGASTTQIPQVQYQDLGLTFTSDSQGDAQRRRCAFAGHEDYRAGRATRSTECRC